MKKKFKKAIAVILTVAMAMSVGAPAFAAETEYLDRVITIQEWTKAVNAEGSKYGIEISQVSVAPGAVITQKNLDEALEIIKLEGEEYLQKKAVLESQKLKNNLVANEGLSVLSIPITKSVSGYANLSILATSILLVLEADVTIDAQNDAVMSVRNPDYYVDLSLGFTNPVFSDVEFMAALNNPAIGYITLTMEGKATGNFELGPIEAVKTFPFVTSAEIDCR